MRMPFVGFDNFRGACERIESLLWHKYLRGLLGAGSTSLQLVQQVCRDELFANLRKKSQGRTCVGGM